MPWPVSMMTGWSTPWLTRVSSKVVSPRLHTQTDRSNQQTRRIAHGFVVVNPLNQRRKGAACRWVGRRHGFLHFPQGFFASASDSLNTSPRGVLWPAEIYAAAVGGLIFVKLKSPAASRQLECGPAAAHNFVCRLPASSAAGWCRAPSAIRSGSRRR